MRRTILKGARVITMDPGRPDHEQLDIRVEDDRIVALAEHIDETDAEIVDLPGRIVVPGFVNAHLHTWQTALRGTGADWTLHEYLARTHGEIARRYTPSDLHIGTLAGALNQLDSGVTTVGDWCHNCRTPDHADAAIEALAEAGIRAVFLHGTAHGGPKKPHNIREVDRLLSGPIAGNELLTLGMAIKGPQLSASETALTDLRAGVERGLLVSMHQSVGRPSAAWRKVADAGLWGPRTNIVHGTGISGQMLHMMVEAGATFTSTPENELAQGHCTSIVEDLLSIGAQVSLGTDTEIAVAGDVLTAARISLARVRARAHDRSRSTSGLSAPEVGISTKHALSWVTTEGARALGLDHRIGSIKPGMQADIVVIDARAFNLWPAHNPLAAALHSHPGNVEAVMVGGEWRKRNHALIHPDLQRIAHELERSAERFIHESMSTGIMTRARREVVRRVVHHAMRRQARSGEDISTSR
ncbi:amidohydrolase family protein [Nocardia nova]